MKSDLGNKIVDGLGVIVVLGGLAALLSGFGVLSSHIAMKGKNTQDNVSEPIAQVTSKLPAQEVPLLPRQCDSVYLGEGNYNFRLGAEGGKYAGCHAWYGNDSDFLTYSTEDYFPRLDILCKRGHLTLSGKCDRVRKGVTGCRVNEAYLGRIDSGKVLPYKPSQRLGIIAAGKDRVYDNLFLGARERACLLSDKRKSVSSAEREKQRMGEVVSALKNIRVLDSE